MLRFVDFELDIERAELRRAGGQAIRLRPKTFATLHLLATNHGRILTKQELMTAIWPNVHVGEDSLFQCIREIRTALGDEKRQLVKSVSGRGYMFDGPVTFGTADRPAAPVDGHAFPELSTEEIPPPLPATLPRSDGMHAFFGIPRRVLMTSLIMCGVLGIATATTMVARRLAAPDLRTIAVMPIETATGDSALTAMATSVTNGLTDGLSKIDNIRVRAAQQDAVAAGVNGAAKADLIIRGELQRRPGQWELQARLIDNNTSQVQWTGSYAVPSESLSEAFQQSRLTAGIGNQIALRINALTHTRVSSPESKIIVEQAAAFLNQTNRERFATAQDLLEKAHTSRPGDVDIASALSAHLMRGVAMVWYPEPQHGAIEERAKDLLADAVQREPNYIPVLQAYCRLLQNTNHLTEALVACPNALRFDPWDGLVMFQIGMAQLRLGRFEDALTTFERADAIDTPQVSRWTWPLGAGVTLLFMGQYERALPWLHRSLAITPGTGRTHLIIAAALQAMGRSSEAGEYVKKALQIRPGTTADNVALPPKNQSARYMDRARDVRALLIAAGLPEN